MKTDKKLKFVEKKLNNLWRLNKEIYVLYEFQTKSKELLKEK